MDILLLLVFAASGFLKFYWTIRVHQNNSNIFAKPHRVTAAGPPPGSRARGARQNSEGSWARIENNPSNRSRPRYRNLLPIKTGLCRLTDPFSDCAHTCTSTCIHQIKKNSRLLRKVLNFASWQLAHDVITRVAVFNVKLRQSELLLFASLPDCSQNQTTVSDIQHLLSDF